MFGKTKQVVGLDIGSSALKAVELKKSGRDLTVSKLAVEPLAPEILVEGAIVDTVAVSNSIVRMFTDHKIKTKNVATSVSGHSVIVKRLSMPPHGRGRSGGTDPVGGRSAHSFRHCRGEPGLADAFLGVLQRRHGRASGGRQEGQDPELYQRVEPGG